MVRPLALRRRLAHGARLRHMVPLYRNLPTALRNRLHLRRAGRPVTYHLRGGVALAMATGAADVIAVNEIWGERCYEPDDRFAVRPGWRVLDLGAHKGGFTTLAASVHPSVEVVAVEPDPRNRALLRTNVDVNGLVNVTVVEGAVGARVGRGGLVEAASSTGHRLAGGGAVEVDVTTIAELVDRFDGPVDLMKVDIEGGEFAAFDAVPDGTWARIERVTMEYHAPPGGTKDEGAARLDEQLRHRGFDTAVDRRHHLLHAWRPAPGGTRSP